MLIDSFFWDDFFNRVDLETSTQRTLGSHENAVKCLKWSTEISKPYLYLLFLFHTLPPRIHGSNCTLIRSNPFFRRASKWFVGLDFIDL